MGFIREPEGVDFFIQSRVLTSAEEKAISDFIRADKAKRQAPQTACATRRISRRKENFAEISL